MSTATSKPAALRITHNTTHSVNGKGDFFVPGAYSQHQARIIATPINRSHPHDLPGFKIPFGSRAFLLCA